jgi:calcineurin-like phosphoesterase family protein
MRITEDTRQDIFDKYMLIKSKIQQLAGIVQNDIEIMEGDLTTHANETNSITKSLNDLSNQIVCAAQGLDDSFVQNSYFYGVYNKIREIYINEVNFLNDMLSHSRITKEEHSRLMQTLEKSKKEQIDGLNQSFKSLRQFSMISATYKLTNNQVLYPVMGTEIDSISKEEDSSDR